MHHSINNYNNYNNYKHIRSDAHGLLTYYAFNVINPVWYIMSLIA